MYSIKKYTSKQREFTFIEIEKKNIKVTFMDYGATILSIFVPDKDGVMESILLAYESLGSYLNNEMYLNATIGPTSGRIADGKFTLNNQEIQLDKNFFDTENIHGGDETLARKFFDYKIREKDDYTKVSFTYRKKPSQSKFPGKTKFRIVYKIYDNDLQIEFKAVSTKDTLVNLTNHAYFNMSGNLKEDIMKQELFVNSSNTLKLNEKFVPTGIKSSKGTHLDFTTMKPIKDNFFDGIYDLPEKGIDNPLMLDDIGFEHKQVSLLDPVSRRQMDVYTTYPCIVCYTHNHPDLKPLLFGVEHKKHMGICFETQNEPNGINVDGLTSSLLSKDKEYYHKTLFKFSVKE